MTPEELEALYHRFDERHATTSDYEAFIDTVHEVITAIREEDARIAEGMFRPDDGLARAYAVGDGIAAAIRRSR